MTSPQERFAANLRRARTAAGVSQEELGDRCNLHRTEISLLERAGREPRLSTIVKLANALDTTLAELCAGITSKATETEKGDEVRRGDVGRADVSKVRHDD